MILIIDCGSKKTPEITQLLHKSNIPQTTITYDNLTSNGLPNNINGIIISGAPILVTEIDPQPYLNTFSFLKNINIPVLGICFGHQILGMTHGATASKCNEDRDWQTIQKLKDSSLFNTLSFPLEMKEDHCEQIDVPTDFILLAKSNVCYNEAMQHKSKPLLGVQFHPEVSDKQGQQLILNFCELCS